MTGKNIKSEEIINHAFKDRKALQGEKNFAEGSQRFYSFLRFYSDYVIVVKRSGEFAAAQIG